MSRAMVEAIAHEMRDDDEVFYMGEDVADYGGIFDSTEGLLEEFGRDRIMDVPISETAYIGAAVGAAQAGNAADCGAHVRRLLRRRHGSDLQPAGQEHLHERRERERPDGADRRRRGTYNDAAQHSQTLYGTFAHLPE